MRDMPVVKTDVLVVGGGIAGFTTAIVAADKLKVHIVAKNDLKQTSTWYAQGGIAAPLAMNDSPALHSKDTLEAGAGLCDPEAVAVLVNEAADAVAMLLDIGTGFDKENGVLQLGREGGHTVSRVVHAGDATGSVVAATLDKAVRSNRNISFSTDVFVVDLLVEEDVCRGVLVYDEKTHGFTAYLASAVVMAAGGMGQIYQATTNPPGATGDGPAMAYRKNVVLSGLEFVQFHPTALSRDSNPRFLISEILRGEGAYLVDGAGERFMVGRHPLAELAPRDLVCQSIVEVMRRDNTDHVYLDARHIPAARLAGRFPAIGGYCLDHGLDLAADRIPVAPAAHYLIGGIKTDLHGRTSLARLYAGGEVASTGVHGANRLASNSLLEGVVFSRRIGSELLERVDPGAVEALPPALSAPARPRGGSLDKVRESLRAMMSEKVGVVRTVGELTAAAAQAEVWRELLAYEYSEPRDWETVNMIIMAELIIHAALARRQSRGVHLVAG